MSRFHATGAGHETVSYAVLRGFDSLGRDHVI